ncbi:MAG: hypothetical protein Q9218_006880, partial [Villophora microphyllina]
MDYQARDDDLAQQQLQRELEADVGSTDSVVQEPTKLASSPTARSRSRSRASDLRLAVYDFLLFTYVAPLLWPLFYSFFLPYSAAGFLVPNKKWWRRSLRFFFFVAGLIALSRLNEGEAPTWSAWGDAIHQRSPAPLQKACQWIGYGPTN